MNSINRRNFLFASSGAAAGSMLVPGFAEAEDDKSLYAGSGLITGTPKPLRHKEVPGFLSAAQLAPHHTAHYGGALKAFVDVDAKIEEAFKQKGSIGVDAFERLKQLQSSRGNSVILHELYFDGLSLKAMDPGEGVRKAIEKRFGSMDKWADDFTASARSAAGWAMLVVHPVNGRLYNVVSDEHAQGPMWMSIPLLVIDTYEHAYYIDYQNKKGEYVAKFLKYVDSTEMERRWRHATKV